MGKEIERKFLVTDACQVRQMASRHADVWQAYLSSSPQAVVRVRVADSQGFITVKGKNAGMTRHEWEYPIPATDATEMIQRLCGGRYIHKTRYYVAYEGFTWEVDAFHHPCDGVVMAEVELQSEAQQPPLPPFVGREVTGDPRYYNSNIVEGSLN